MAKNTYPAECPVFEYEGSIVTARPEFVYIEFDDPSATIGRIIPVTRLHDVGGISADQFEEALKKGLAKPLTRAARQLVAWSRR